MSVFTSLKISEQVNNKLYPTVANIQNCSNHSYAEGGSNHLSSMTQIVGWIRSATLYHTVPPPQFKISFLVYLHYIKNAYLEAMKIYTNNIGSSL